MQQIVYIVIGLTRPGIELMMEWKVNPFLLHCNVADILYFDWLILLDFWCFICHLSFGKSQIVLHSLISCFKKFNEDCSYLVFMFNCICILCISRRWCSKLKNVCLILLSCFWTINYVWAIWYFYCRQLHHNKIANVMTDSFDDCKLRTL